MKREKRNRFKTAVVILAGVLNLFMAAPRAQAGPDYILGADISRVQDEKKGERLVVLHTVEDGVLDGILEKLSDAEMPNLWKPKRGQFVSVVALPYLGTGKLDLKGLQRMAQELG